MQKTLGTTASRVKRIQFAALPCRFLSVGLDIVNVRSLSGQTWPRVPDGGRQYPPPGFVPPGSLEHRTWQGAFLSRPNRDWGGVASPDPTFRHPREGPCIGPAN